MSTDKWKGLAIYSMAELALRKGGVGRRRLKDERAEIKEPNPKKPRPEAPVDLGVIDPERDGFLNAIVKVSQLDHEYDSFSALAELRVVVKNRPGELGEDQEVFIPVEFVIYTQEGHREVRIKFCSDESPEATVFFRTTEIVAEVERRARAGQIKKAVRPILSLQEPEAAPSVTPSAKTEPATSEPALDTPDEASVASSGDPLKIPLPGAPAPAPEEVPAAPVYSAPSELAMPPAATDATPATEAHLASSAAVDVFNAPKPDADIVMEATDPATQFPIVRSDVKFSRTDSPMDILMALSQEKKARKGNEDFILSLIVEGRAAQARIDRQGEQRSIVAQIRFVDTETPSAWINVDQWLQQTPTS